MDHFSYRMCNLFFFFFLIKRKQRVMFSWPNSEHITHKVQPASHSRLPPLHSLLVSSLDVISHLRWKMYVGSTVSNPVFSTKLLQYPKEIQHESVRWHQPIVCLWNRKYQVVMTWTEILAQFYKKEEQIFILKSVRGHPRCHRALLVGAEPHLELLIPRTRGSLAG